MLLHFSDLEGDTVDSLADKEDSSFNNGNDAINGNDSGEDSDGVNGNGPVKDNADRQDNDDSFVNPVTDLNRVKFSLNKI
jgi:catechol-2,3-dioxygenase